MQKLTTNLSTASLDQDPHLLGFDTTGFGIRVLPTGVKTFVAQAKVAGRMHTVTIGDVPT